MVLTQLAVLEEQQQSLGETILEDAGGGILIREAMVAKGMNSGRTLVSKCEMVTKKGSVKFSFTKKVLNFH